MKFLRLVINCGRGSFVNWLTKRLYYKPIIFQVESSSYVFESRYVDTDFPYLLFVAVEYEKSLSDPDDLLLSMKQNQAELEARYGQWSDRENEKIEDEVREEKLDQSSTAEKHEFETDEYIKQRDIVSDVLYGPDYLLSQVFLVSLDENKTEVYFVIYFEEIEDLLQSLIKEIESFWTVTINEQLSNENWYRNYSFFPMYPIGQNGLSDEAIIEQVFPTIRNKPSKKGRTSSQSYNIPKKIYSNESNKYDWINDEYYMRQYFDGYSIYTMTQIILNFKEAYKRYKNVGGVWGPNQIAYVIDRNADYVGKYLKALRKIGVESIDEIAIPYKLRV